MPKKSDPIPCHDPSPETPKNTVPRYRKPRLVPHGQLKPAGFLLGTVPDPP